MEIMQNQKGVTSHMSSTTLITALELHPTRTCVVSAKFLMGQRLCAL